MVNGGITRDAVTPKVAVTGTPETLPAQVLSLFVTLNMPFLRKCSPSGHQRALVLRQHRPSKRSFIASICAPTCAANEVRRSRVRTVKGTSALAIFLNTRGQRQPFVVQPVNQPRVEIFSRHIRVLRGKSHFTVHCLLSALVAAADLSCYHITDNFSRFTKRIHQDDCSPRHTATLSLVMAPHGRCQTLLGPVRLLRICTCKCNNIPVLPSSTVTKLFIISLRAQSCQSLNHLIPLRS